MEAHIGYAYLPPDSSGVNVQQLRSLVRDPLLSFINFNKERHSLIQSLAGRYVLQNLLITNDININNISLSLTNYKKPIILNSDYNFSISHSGNLAVSALSVQQEVGIDVELKKDIAFSDFRTQFSDAEYRELTSGKDSGIFYRMWTAKEAVSKAIGAGLYLDFNKIELVEEQIFRVGSEQWIAEQIPLDPAYECTLAGRNPWFQKYLHQINIEL